MPEPVPREIPAGAEATWEMDRTREFEPSAIPQINKRPLKCSLFPGETSRENVFSELVFVLNIDVNADVH